LSLARKVPSSRRSAVRVAAGAIACVAMLAGASALAGAARSSVISAHLTKKSFTKEQVETVDLIYSFATTSKSFGYLLSFKRDSAWLKVKSVKKSGAFRGSKKSTVKQLFAGRSPKVGEYRLELRSDGGSKRLGFTIKNSEPVNTVLPTIAAAAGPAETFTASTGSWKYSPTSYAYRWRRCDGAGANCSDINGADASAYSLSAEDAVGSSIRVVVTAFNPNGSAIATSTAMAIGGTVRAISAGDYHTCALSSGGTVKCWGNNDDGQLGNGQTTASSTAVLVKGTGGAGVLSKVTQVGTGVSHSCALLASGIVECWGWNGEGELGTGETSSSATPIPVQVRGVGGVGALSNVAQISAGSFHTCALLTNHTVECWGWNNQGQLGYNTAPVQVKGIGGVGTLSDVVQISAGGARTCALLTDGTVECWGSNGRGQLGDGTRIDSLTPVQVKDAAGVGVLLNATQVSTGGLRTCALLADRTVQCWGAGWLGDGTTIDSTIPVPVVGYEGIGPLSNVTQISTGVSHTCALLTDGTVECWGGNLFGALGNVGSSSPTPVQVTGVGGSGLLSDAIQISTGDDDTCALRSDNTVVCWGYNESGQLGNGTRIDSWIPLPVKGVGGAGMF